MEAAAHGHSTLGIPESVGKEFVAADSMNPVKAAGVLFNANGKILLVKRSGTATDHPNEWAFPGGGIEEGESAIVAAIRECQEELEYSPKLPMRLVSERDGFATFLSECEMFMPQLNSEHQGFIWAEPNALPMPIHPNAQATVNDVLLGKQGQTRTELDVAKAVMVGDIKSGVKFANVWLFNLRITGTGVAYRSEGEEFVFRDPKLYMNDAFLQRCNGLSVIWKHPGKNMLDSKEFSDRVVGSIALPYFKSEAEEVWCVAKIYDEEAANAMLDEQLSTSPGVVFRKSDGNKLINLENGDPLLIEGCPSLLDHLAICSQGVWDKGGEPAGVISDSKGASEMSEKETRADAEPDKLDKIMSKLDAMEKRMDAYETKKDADVRGVEAKGEESKKADEQEPEKKQGENEVKADEDKEAKKDSNDMPADPLMSAADKAKKDSDEKLASEAKKKAVEAEALAKAAHDSIHGATSEVKGLIADLERRLPKELSDADYAAMADAQAKADSIYHAFGDSAPRPLNGEDLLAYRKRLSAKLKTHSAQWKDVDINKLDANVFSIAEAKIYADAMEAAVHPVDLPAGGLREITKHDRAGRKLSEFIGSPSAWMNQFKTPRLRQVRINKEGK
jgi:8-oxo-dGTP pyrophosphatase MutT (NUDIX family)/predicted DCC family thiol-disulfide oxidoreductase YuxK